MPVVALLLLAATSASRPPAAAAAAPARACDGVKLLSQPLIASGIWNLALGNLILEITGPVDDLVLCQEVGLRAGRQSSAGHCDNARGRATDLRRKLAAKAVRCLIDKERTKRGLSPLSAQHNLTKAAKNHSSLMVSSSCFEHQCGGEADLVGRVTSADYLPCTCAWTVGENIAWGRRDDSSPAAIVDAWMHSPPHRELILTAGISDVGVGVAVGAPGNAKAKAGTYTADFGTKG